MLLFQTSIEHIEKHFASKCSPPVTLKSAQAMFAVATGLSMKDMQGVFQAQLQLPWELP